MSNPVLKKMQEEIKSKSTLIQETQKKRHEVQVTRQQAEVKIQNIDDKTTKIIENMIFKHDVLATKEQEEVRNALRSFSERQKVMNEQLITLNQSLSSSDALEASYRIKRELLETEYAKMKRDLDQRITSLTLDEQKAKGKLTKTEQELQDIIKELKKKTFLDTFKNKIEKASAWVLAFFLIGVLGVFLGWGTGEIIKGILSGIGGFFSGIFEGVSNYFRMF